MFYELYDFYQTSWNDVLESLSDNKKEWIDSKQGLKQSLYCSVVSVLSSIIEGRCSIDTDKMVDRIRSETGISLKKEVLENIIRRYYEN